MPLSVMDTQVRAHFFLWGKFDLKYVVVTFVLLTRMAVTLLLFCTKETMDDWPRHPRSCFLNYISLMASVPLGDGITVTNDPSHRAVINDN